MRSASFILLDRALAIDKVAIVEICEQVIYSVMAIALAFFGFGVWSFICGWIAKPFIGWLMARAYAPWRWRFYYHLRSFDGLGKVAKKGLLYQLPAILETVRASINPVFIRSLLGAGSAGFVDRAVLFASMPANILSGVWSKILFPYFAKTQDNKEESRTVFEQSVYIHAVIDKVLYLPFLTFLPELVTSVIGVKWLPIVPLMYILISGNLVFSALSVTSNALISGFGRPIVLARWAPVQLLAAWVLSVVLVRSFGIEGYAFVSIFLWLGVVYSYYHVRQLIGSTHVFSKLAPPLVAFSVSLALMLFVKLRLSRAGLSIPDIFFLSVVEVTGYLLLLYLLDRQQLSTAAKRIRLVVGHMGWGALEKDGMLPG